MINWILDFSTIFRFNQELAEPSIKDAFGICVQQGANRVIVSPFFLFPGRHWNQVAVTLTFFENIYATSQQISDFSFSHVKKISRCQFDVLKFCCSPGYTFLDCWSRKGASWGFLYRNCSSRVAWAACGIYSSFLCIPVLFRYQSGSCAVVCQLWRMLKLYILSVRLHSFRTFYLTLIFFIYYEPLYFFVGIVLGNLMAFLVNCRCSSKSQFYFILFFLYWGLAG